MRKFLILLLLCCTPAFATDWYQTFQGSSSHIGVTYKVPEDCTLIQITTWCSTPGSAGTYSAGVDYQGQYQSDHANTAGLYAALDYATSTVITTRNAPIYNPLPLKEGDNVKVTLSQNSTWTVVLGFHKDDAIVRRTPR